MTKEVELLIKKLRGRTPAPPLVPQKSWNAQISRELKNLSAPGSLKASLYLWNDDLDKAHKMAQEIPTATGSLIHGIMHRREPDYENSKYWFRRVGRHPLFEQMRKDFPKWEPFWFVDACAALERGGKDPSRDWLENVQAKELALLVDTFTLS